MVLIDLQFEIGEGQYLSPAPSPLLFGKKRLDAFSGLRLPVTQPAVYIAILLSRRCHFIFFRKKGEYAHGITWHIWHMLEQKECVRIWIKS